MRSSLHNFNPSHHMHDRSRCREDENVTRNEYFYSVSAPNMPLRSHTNIHDHVSWRLVRACQLPRMAYLFDLSLLLHSNNKQPSLTAVLTCFFHLPSWHASSQDVSSARYVTALFFLISDDDFGDNGAKIEDNSRFRGRTSGRDFRVRR
jgi:hypothetical protein